MAKALLATYMLREKGGCMVLKVALLSSLCSLLALPSLADEFPLAPRFTLKTVDNEVVVLDSLLGKGPIVVSFWATWCKPCAAEHDRLRKIYEELKGRGLEILAISQDGPRSVSRVKPFATGRKLQYPILLDPEKEVGRLYNISAIPALFILDGEGRIRFTHRGFKPGDEVLLREEIERLLPLEHIEEEEEEEGK